MRAGILAGGPRIPRKVPGTDLVFRCLYNNKVSTIGPNYRPSSSDVVLSIHIRGVQLKKKELAICISRMFIFT